MPTQRILVVDDDPHLRTVLVRVLEAAGYPARAAPDGVTAMRLHREQPADLVLTDLFMPDKDGIELLLELQGLDPGLPVIVMSGETAEHLTSLADARMLGAVRTLQKPFTTQELLDTIARALRPPSRGCA